MSVLSSARALRPLCIAALCAVLASCGGESANDDVGSGGTAGAAGGPDSGACSPDGGTGVTVSGDLIAYGLPALQTAAFKGRAKVVMEGVSCPWVVAEYDSASSASFTLQDVQQSDQSWMHVYDESMPVADVLPTLLPVFTQQDLSLNDAFGFVRRSEIDAVYSALGVIRSPEKATVVVQLVEVVSGLPTSAGTASMTGAEAHAYASGGSWKPDAETDASGVIVALNVQSGAFPGASAAGEAKLGPSHLAFTAQCESGAVSIVWLGMGLVE